MFHGRIFPAEKVPDAWSLSQSGAAVRAAGIPSHGSLVLLALPGRLPAQGRSERAGQVGQDLNVVLRLEGERQREGDFPDLAETGVRVQCLGDLAGGAEQV